MLERLPTHSIRSEEELASIPDVKPHVDPILKRKRVVYLAFLRLLNDKKLSTWRQRSRCEAGLFFVDARAAKRVFRPPPGVMLTTVENIILIHTDETDASRVEGIREQLLL